MKKKITTKSWAKKYLPRVRKLLRWYQGEENECRVRCPLCIEKFTEGCGTCPWLVFSGRKCWAHKRLFYPNDCETMSDLRKQRLQPWTRNRIRTLRRWEKRLLEIICGERFSC